MAWRWAGGVCLNRAESGLTALKHGRIWAGSWLAEGPVAARGDFAGGGCGADVLWSSYPLSLCAAAPGYGRDMNTGGVR